MFPQFSNGNSGPGCSTAGSPGDYAESYSAGAFDVNGVIASFSSRGSSAFGGIKPDIAAPGVDIRSSLPGGTYGNFNGTSMAAPHVAGTVALVWSAAPAYKGNIEATIRALDATAHDVADLQCGGTTVDNNVWGEGTLDAFAAVAHALDDDPDEAVAFTGTVTDGSGHGWPLYARVDIAGDPDATVFTDPVTGSYRAELLEGRTYQVTATAMTLGYRPMTSTVTTLSTPTTRDFALGIEPTCVAAGYTTSAGTPYLAETFDTAVTPAGWSVVNRTPSGGWRFDDRGGRGNLSGGTGGFAIIDSDELGIGNSQDTDLVTPALDLSAAVAPMLTFNGDYRAFPNSAVDVEVSTDGGIAWTNLWHFTTSDRRGPRVETIAVPAAGADAVQLRFRYRGTWAWWWQVDNVTVRDACAIVPGGLVVGTVSDADTAAAINGATVTSDDHPADTATSGPTPDDPNLEDGFYSVFSTLSGRHPFSASAAGYESTTDPIDVVADAVVRHDFELVAPAPELSIADAGLAEPDDGTAPMTFTITADPAPAEPITVVVNTADGTAVAPADYTPIPAGGQVVTFAAGQTTHDVLVPIVGDHLAEPDETFTVTLTGPTGRAVIADGSATGTIANDDTCTIVGTPGPDVLVGTSGDDDICGLGGNDVITGGSGHDTLRGDAGDDVVDGGSGNDVIDGGSGHNRIVGGSGRDAITTGDGNDVIDLGTDADTVVDAGGANGIQAGSGDDTVTSGAGADVVDMGSGNDVADVGDGNNQVLLGSGDDSVTAGSGDDVIDGGTGLDRCVAGTGTNRVVRCER
jgi:Ca2+-binding RTX toxin-like protein